MNRSEWRCAGQVERHVPHAVADGLGGGVGLARADQLVGGGFDGQERGCGQVCQRDRVGAEVDGAGGEGGPVDRPVQHVGEELGRDVDHVVQVGVDAAEAAVVAPEEIAEETLLDAEIAVRAGEAQGQELQQAGIDGPADARVAVRDASGELGDEWRSAAIGPDRRW